MKDIEFNLLDEPWIRVINNKCEVREVSLRWALLNAHHYSGLKGELPTQDVAILRILLAVLYRVFLQVDPDGTDIPIQDIDQAFERWESLWDYGRIPEEPVNSYLDQWHERFWLFHTEYPFFQVPAAENGTKYTGAKLNGELSESSNKLKLFPVKTGESRETLSYPEAARWLIYLNAYDDTSSKPKGKNLPSPGAGWLGKLGLIYPEGNNLFETLILNLALLKNGEKLWEEGFPIWENEEVRSQERSEIVMPGNPSALLTLQSRRILLHRQNGKVDGYSLLGGDFFDRVNADAEQMTVWIMKKEKGKPTDEYIPRRHNPATQMWREFPVLFLKQDVGRRPGIVEWMNALIDEKVFSSEFVRFKIASVQYGDKDFFVTDVYSDGLEFHQGLLDKLAVENSSWIIRIQDEIKKTEDAARYLNYLEEGLQLAAGNRNLSTTVTEQFFERVDLPFRRWLRSLDPGRSLMASENLFMEWENTVSRIAINLGRDLVEEAGIVAFSGRTIEGSDKKAHYYASADAFNVFLYNIRKIYPVKSKEEITDE